MNQGNIIWVVEIEEEINYETVVSTRVFLDENRARFVAAELQHSPGFPLVNVVARVIE